MVIKPAVCEFVERWYRDWLFTFNAAAVDSSNILKAKETFCLSNVEGQQALEVNLGANLATECWSLLYNCRISSKTALFVAWIFSKSG